MNFPNAQVLQELLSQEQATVPGLQYVVVGADGIQFEYVGGWADIQKRKAMTTHTTQMAYSMTKVFTAAAILQLVERGILALDERIARYIPDNPYDERITIRQLLCHTSGIPNPIPLRWVHLAYDHAHFDEPSALTRVVQSNRKLAFIPGTKYLYSNIGYWLLGQIIERTTRQTYTNYVSENILHPLGFEKREMSFQIADWSNHATGYLRKYSMLNLLKGFVTDRQVWGNYTGDWLALKNHYVNGPAFGGLVGSARAFSRFLQDQLQAHSILMKSHTRQLYYTEQMDRHCKSIAMTLGWHVGKLRGTRYFFKEGGGGGFHGEMRIYPTKGIGSVLVVNATEFDSNKIANQLDAGFLEAQQLLTPIERSA